MTIDWTTIAEPQNDGSDTEQIKQLVVATGFAWPIPAAAPTILGAAVRDVDFDAFSDALATATATELDVDFITEVETLLQIWPTYTTQLEQLLTRVYPVLMQGGRRPSIIGGTSGTRQRDVSQYFGMIYGTADTPHGLAGAIVSGIGNWKLYAMGVTPDTWNTALFTNTVDALIPNPLRDGDYQPFGAVLHTQYALLHTLEWNLRLAQTRPLGRPNRALFSVRKHVPRIQRGLSILGTAACSTEAGGQLITGITTWSQRLLEACAEWL